MCGLCLVSKIFNKEMSEEELWDIVFYIYGFSLMPFCSKKSM